MDELVIKAGRYDELVRTEMLFNMAKREAFRRAMDSKELTNTERVIYDLPEDKSLWFDLSEFADILDEHYPGLIGHEYMFATKPVNPEDDGETYTCFVPLGENPTRVFAEKYDETPVAYTKLRKVYKDDTKQ